MLRMELETMAVDLETRQGIVDEEILLILSKKLKHEWRDAGKHLTLSDFDLDELESNKNYGMLRKWKQLKGKDATYSKLKDALEKVNRPELVILVNKELEKRSLADPTKLHEAPCEPVAKRLKVMTASETESEDNITNIPVCLTDWTGTPCGPNVSHGLPFRPAGSTGKCVGKVESSFSDAGTSFTSQSPIEEDSSLCLQLGKIAFDGFDKKNPVLFWSKRHLVQNLGCDGYETYKTAGILVEDGVFHERTDGEQHFDKEPQPRVRFFDNCMEEYYAAHYLVQLIKDIDARDISEYLENFNPRNLQYLYLFACGLDDTVANKLMNFLLDNNKQDQAALSIMEIEDTNKVKELFSTIFDCNVTIKTTCDSKHLQRAKTFLVATASKFKIPLPSVELEDLLGSLNVTTGNFETKDGLHLPSLCYVKRLYLKDEGRVWTEEEFNGVLEYAAGCDGLEILEFSHCMVPYDVSEEADIPKISSKTFYVQWRTVNNSFVLHLRPFKWLVSNYLLSGNAVLWELWKLEKGGPPFNNFRILDQLWYENIDRDFYIKYRDSKWQKTHISTTPRTRNCVSDATLTELSQKIEGDWTAIAARLQINEFFLNGITRRVTDGTDGSPQKIMYETLKAWKDLESEHASPQVLERALRSAAQDDAADELNAVLIEESVSLVAASTIYREGGTVQIDGTGVELEIPPDAFQDIQGDQRVQITILPNRSLDKTAKCFEDNTTVMVQLLPHNLSLRPAAKLILPHCLKLKNVVNSDVKIFCSYHKTGMEPLWEDVTKSVKFKLLETGCEIHLHRLCAIKYTISGNQVEAKRLKWYALGNKCKEDAKYVTVDIGYHLDLPGENEVYRGKLQDKFLGDSQSFFVFKEELPSYPSVSLVQVLPVWELRPVTAVSMSTSRPRTVLSSKQCCSFTFKRPCSSASLPRCVFEIAGDPQQPKYRLTVNFRALQKPVANTNVVTDDALFYLSHGLEDAWKNIGRRLLVDENDLREISKRDVSQQLKAYLMLIKWKESVGETAFVEILIRVLNDEKTGLAKKLPASLIDGDASSHEKNKLILPDKYSLMDSSDVSVEGGEVRISDTDIELNILPDSFQGPFEKHKIQLKVLPDNLFQEPAKCFEAHSTTIVELLPSDLRLKRPASLFLPHCLKLKSAKYCEVQVFQSHHAKGQNPLWEDAKTLEYTLSESNCEIKIKRFGWIKYTLRGTQVEAKKLKLYALGEDCDRDAKYVTVDVGYHLDLPGHDDIIQHKLNGKFLGNSKQFLCFKEPREDLEVKFLEANPEWRLANNPEVPRKISFPRIESSVEESCFFKFKRPHHNSNLPKCVFEISQGKQPVPENITIAFTPQNLQPYVEDRGDAAQSHLLKQDLQRLEQTTTLRKTTRDEIWTSLGVPLGRKQDDFGCLEVSSRSRTVPNICNVKEIALVEKREELSRKIGKEWKNIGRRLQFLESEIENISSQHDGLQERAYQMLYLWMGKVGENATIEALQQALRDANRSDLADDLYPGFFLSQD